MSGGCCEGLAGLWIPSATRSSSSSTGCTCPSPAQDLPFWGWHMPSSLQVFVGFPSCPYGLLLGWLCHPVMVWGHSSLLSALYTGPCHVEIGAALPKVAVSEETAEIQPTQGHPAGTKLPFLVPWGDLLALTIYCAAIQVVFLVLSCKEELDVMMTIPFLPNPHSAPSFSGMHDSCKWSKALLPLCLAPRPCIICPSHFSWSLTLGQKCCLPFSLVTIPG